MDSSLRLTRSKTFEATAIATLDAAYDAWVAEPAQAHAALIATQLSAVHDGTAMKYVLHVLYSS